MFKYIFPIILITLDLCTASVYAVNTDWKKAAYWVAAATLNYCVTF